MATVARELYGSGCGDGEEGWAWNGYTLLPEEQEQSWEDNAEEFEVYPMPGEGFPLGYCEEGDEGYELEMQGGEDVYGWSQGNYVCPAEGPFIQESSSEGSPDGFPDPPAVYPLGSLTPLPCGVRVSAVAPQCECPPSPRQSLTFPSEEPFGSTLQCNQYHLSDESLLKPLQHTKPPEATPNPWSPSACSPSNQPAQKFTFFHSHQPPTNEVVSRKQFKETIGVAFYHDLESGNFSYEEIINKYSKMYPQFAHKFTRDFCSKVRCGRIMKLSPQSEKTRVKRIVKLSQRRKWKKLTTKLFYVIYDWEKSQNQPIKQSDVEERFNVNRSTYYRWKKNYESNGNPQP
eukprot:TRINITY_DN20846_c0_g2_i7.p1 TRINITY_DN20846_c0_g2~~TRINITY_DN20846_c0_g2_i7.p1  ORF type:complete len:345 (+),score=73.25 TRINITY_DN20846_c0_g2_i7:60-1094(+)